MVPQSLIFIFTNDLHCFFFTEPKDSKPTKVYDNSGGVSAWDRLMGGSNKPKGKCFTPS